MKQKHKYLEKPLSSGVTYGELEYDDVCDQYVLSGDPAMLEMAKRMFPGSDVLSRRSRKVVFRPTKRMVGDLNWFMLRFPLEMDTETRKHFDGARKDAIEHVGKRDAIDELDPIAQPGEFPVELLGFQREGAAYLIHNERTVVGDETGLGKTYTALSAAMTVAKYPVLVVVQPHLRLQWKRNIETVYGEGSCHVVKGMKGYDLPNVPFIVVHYGLLRKWKQQLLDANFEVMIFDEIQDLRHTGTQKYSVASLVACNARYVWGLSGTPIHGYGAEIWAVMNIVEFQCLSSFESFTREWCIGYGEKIVEDPEALGAHLRREGLLLRRRIEDVDVEIPRVRRVVQSVDANQGTYNKMIAKAVKLAKEYKQIKGWKARGKAALEIDGLSRRAAGLAKVDHVVEFVDALIEGGEKPLVFAYHHDVHDALMERLKHRSPVKVTGREAQKTKDANVRWFSEGQTDLAIISLRCGAGTDGLQKHATCCVFAELDWAPAIHKQCEARIERMGASGSLESILSYYCVSDTGYDVTMRDVLGLKTAQFTMLMDDKAETEEDRDGAQEMAASRIKQIVELLSGEKLEEEKAPRKVEAPKVVSGRSQLRRLANRARQAEAAL